jgi:hypothetical protein
VEKNTLSAIKTMKQGFYLIIKAVWKEWIKCYRLSRQHEETGHYPFIKITRPNVTQLSCEG